MSPPKKTPQLDTFRTSPHLPQRTTKRWDYILGDQCKTPSGAGYFSDEQHPVWDASIGRKWERLQESRTKMTFGHPTIHPSSAAKHPGPRRTTVRALWPRNMVTRPHLRSQNIFLRYRERFPNGNRRGVTGVLAPPGFYIDPP